MLFLMRAGSRALSLGHMRAMALVLGLAAAMGCSRTYYVGADGGEIAVCGAGFTICEPAAAVDGGEAEYPLVCSDLQSDGNNCGACGASCGHTRCAGGKCQCNAYDGECAKDSDCCNGICLHDGLCGCASAADCANDGCGSKPCTSCNAATHTCEL